MDTIRRRRKVSLHTSVEEEYMRQIVLSLLVDNNPGVLARVGGSFQREGIILTALQPVSRMIQSTLVLQ